MLPLSRFLVFAEQNQLFTNTDKVLLAVSGGKDSVLMTHLFNEAGIKFGIAHCNFGLRAEESDQDQQFCMELASRLNVPFFSIVFNTQEFAWENKISIQMAARQLRYQWFEELRRELGYSTIALAQHKNDTVETVLLNLVRGAGLGGLHGILPKRDKLIRPMLFLTRHEINQIIETDGLAFREDSSNGQIKYARNKIRHEVVPKLKELNADLESTFAKNCQRFFQAESFLQRKIGEIRQELFKIEGNSININIADLGKLEPLDFLLFELFKPYNFKEPVLTNLTQAWNGEPGKVFESETHCLLLDRSALILTQKMSAKESESSIKEDQALVSHGNFSFSLSVVEPTNISFKADKNVAYFDAELLHFPLKLRPWKEGDFFYPFGMKGKKKLSDYFIAEKLSRLDKTKVSVLENGNGDIIWVCGHRSDERYKVTSRSKKVIIFEKQKRP